MDDAHRPQPDPPLLIGECRVEPSLLLLHRDGREWRLEPKAMALLVFLADRAPRVVSRAEILDGVWQGRAVVDETLTRCVSLLRRALGDDAQAPRYIETIPRRGYRLKESVRRGDFEAAPAAETDSHGTGDPNSTAVGDSGDGSDLETPDETAAGQDDGDATAVPRLRPGIRPRGRSGPLSRLVPFAALLLFLMLAFVALRSPTPPAGDEPESRNLAPPSMAPRLAVLPFENLSGHAADQYLCDGMTEELIHQLAALSGLRVVSRTSTTSELIKGLDTAGIAQRLRVDYLLEGSVLTVDGGLRITAQLIRPDRDEHLWSRSYDRPLTDVLALHREVALDVARQVEAGITAPEAHRLGRSRTVDPEAYRLYLEASQHLARRTPKDVISAIEGLQKAVTIDEDFAEAWSALANAHLLSDPYLKVAQTVAYDRARRAIERALHVEPDLASAHVSLGLLLLFRDWDWRGSEAAYRRAVVLEPSHAGAHQWLSEMLSLAGRHDEALREIRLAVDLDPLSPLVHAAWGQRLNAAGQHREALRRFEQADALGATFYWHWREIAFAHERLGSAAAALEARLIFARRSPASESELAELVAATEADGLLGYWRWQLPRLLAPTTAEPVLIAEAMAALGDTEGALPWLQTAVRKRGGWFLHLRKSPAFDALRDDPRFVALLAEADPGAQ